MARRSLSWVPRSVRGSRRDKAGHGFHIDRGRGSFPVVEPQRVVSKGPVTNMVRTSPCPVCQHPEPGVLENHLRNYHKLGDMRDALRALLGRELPRQLSQLISIGEVGAVSRVLANFALTGLLQVPTVTLPSRTTTRVLWKAIP